MSDDTHNLEEPRPKHPGGRPPLFPGDTGMRRHVCLPDSYVEVARDLGAGYVSAGIRFALEFTAKILLKQRIK